MSNLALKPIYHQPQTAPPPSRSLPLPTMYDLPSDNPEDPGLPDQFHEYQPQLLSETFRPPRYPSKDICVAADLNLYYDVDHPTWYKRPDWFAATGVPQFYEGHDLRMSYVIWQEKKAPFIVVELLSQSSEKEDLGKTPQDAEPPTKWQVYEHILRIPYYVLFSRDHKKFQVFQMGGTRYRKIEPDDGRLWFLELNFGLGLWEGVYRDFRHRWLRWYDADGKWIPTAAERAKHEKQRADMGELVVEQERQRANLGELVAEQERLRANKGEQIVEVEKQRADQEFATPSVTFEI